jgi:hypothetical protein
MKIVNCKMYFVWLLRVASRMNVVNRGRVWAKVGIKIFSPEGWHVSTVCTTRPLYKFGFNLGF